MKLFYKSLGQIHTLLSLRVAAISIQVLTILVVYFGLKIQLPLMPLFTIIVIEIVFTILSYLYYKSGKEADRTSLFIQIVADTLFLSLLLYFSGGATNAFVSLLLIPIAIAAVTLTPIMLSAVALLAVFSYSVLLWLMPMHVMHGNMEGHFIGMWVNFLFSTTVVAFVVANMARRINQRELAIAAYREEQLKQEKVISLGVASAQVTHQLATPIATVQLLADELKEDYPDSEALDEMQAQLTRCKDSLASFRQMVFDIKEQVATAEDCSIVINKIQDNISLNYPDVEMSITHSVKSLSPDAKGEQPRILADASLLPAILNLINNAIRATKANQSNKIELFSEVTDDKWQLAIRDFGAGFTQSTLEQLGVSPVSSEQGFGMAVLLSHSSLERLGGSISLTNHQEGGAKVVLTMPLAK